MKKIANQIEIMRLHGMSRDAWKRYMPEGEIPKWNCMGHMILNMLV